MRNAAPLRSVDDNDHDGAIQSALAFLQERHRKARDAAFDAERAALMPEVDTVGLTTEVERALTIDVCEPLAEARVAWLQRLRP